MFSTVKMLRQAALTIFRQQQHIMRLEHDLIASELAHMRVGRDLLEQFLIALDNPEDQDEFRKRLSVSLGFYRDEIAVKEEHAR